MILNMLHNNFFFDREFALNLYNEHQFSPDLDILRGDAAIFYTAFLLWVKRLSTLPTVRLDQVARLLVWGKDNICYSNSQDFSNMIVKANLAWKEIILYPCKQSNPALCLLILKNINSDHTTLSLQKLASQLCLNPSYLSRVISRDLKCSFPELLQCRKILLSVDLLRIPRRKLSIENISNELGYSSAHYFYCVFKSYTGVTPAIIREILLLLDSVH